MAHIGTTGHRSTPRVGADCVRLAAAMWICAFNSTRTMAHMGQLPFVFSVLFGTIMGGDAKAIVARFAGRYRNKQTPKKICRQSCYSLSLIV